jgi:hypothetical protein
MGNKRVNAKMKDEPGLVSAVGEKSDTETEVECTTTDYVSDVDDIEPPKSRSRTKSPARECGKDEADADESTVTTLFSLPLSPLRMQLYIHIRPNQLRTAPLNIPIPRVGDKDLTVGFVPLQLPLLHHVPPKPPKPLTPPNNTHGELTR